MAQTSIIACLGSPSPFKLLFAELVEVSSASSAPGRGEPGSQSILHLPTSPTTEGSGEEPDLDGEVVFVYCCVW